MIDKTTKMDLINYVKDQHLNTLSEKRIYNFCLEQTPLNITVYRGHFNDKQINPSHWYSSSKKMDVAHKEFAGKECCLFIIHLINTMGIDVNAFVGNEIGDKNQEEEVIFVGGGTFYQNDTCTTTGFKDVGMTQTTQTYECWYSLNPPSVNTDSMSHRVTNKESITNVNNVEKALSVIDEDEYEFIHNVNDIHVDIPLTSEEKQQVLDEILRRTSVGGAKRKSKKMKHASKRLALNKNNTKKNKHKYVSKKNQYISKKNNLKNLK